MALAQVNPNDFNPLRENLGMVSMAVVVLVFWLLYRKMIELTKRQEARLAPWKAQLRAAGVTDGFIEGLERLQLVHAEEPWPWLPVKLLSAENKTFFAADLGPWRKALGSDDVVPVCLEADDVALLWSKGRFVRVRRDGHVLAELKDFRAVLESYLTRVWNGAHDAVHLRRFADLTGYGPVEALLTTLESSK